MENTLNDVFEQARKLVGDVDRKIAEEQERLVTLEKQAKINVVSAQIEEAFDFSSREKIELNTRVDVHDGVGALEFVVRSARAMFLMSQDQEGSWRLRVIEADKAPHDLGWFQSGDKSLAAHENGSRRLAAARVVTAISSWVLESKASTPGEPTRVPSAVEPPRPTRVPEAAEVQQPVRAQEARTPEIRTQEVRTQEPRPQETRIQDAAVPGWKPPVSATAPKPNFGTFGKIFGH